MAVAPKPKAVPKKVVPKPAVPQPRKKKKLPKGYNPVTRQPYEKKSGSGYVEKGAVSLDNLKRGKRRRKREKGDFSNLGGY